MFAGLRKSIRMPKSTTKTLKVLGWKIQRLRKHLGVTQEEFAHQVGISRVYMGYIEQGRESPGLRLLIKIARKLEVKIESLFHR